MKHYPVLVAGEKATACIHTEWNVAVISFKFSHRKGQVVKIAHSKSILIESAWIDSYPTYTAIRFTIKQQYFSNAMSAMAHCAGLIESVNRSVNFDAEEALISKELLVIMG